MNPDLNAWSTSLAALPYPAELRCVDRGITGSGFYPGARNCLFGDPASPSVMLIGRDFGTLTYYSSLAAKPGRGEHALTWRHTQDTYVKSLNRPRAFCTNYLMGVRVDGSAKGDLRDRLAASDWAAFEEACWKFLQKQLMDCQPDLIVVFGADNQRDLDKPQRLSGLKYRTIHGPHPHSAIGEKNAAPHRQLCLQIKKELGILDPWDRHFVDRSIR